MQVTLSLKWTKKPLKAILSKSINQATPRLQRILIRAFPYHFTVRYLLVLKNQLADYLSRVGGQKDEMKLPKLHLVADSMLEVTVYNS